MLPGEFADDGSGPVPGRHRHRDNPVMPELLHLRESGALNLRAKELTKRRRTGRVCQWAGQQMEPCGFRLAGNEQPMRFAWHANVEEQEAIAGLMYFLNPSLNKDGSDLVKHMFNFGSAQCHVARASHDREMKLCRLSEDNGRRL